MNSLSNFWRRLSHKGSGVALILDRAHPIAEDIRMLQSSIVGFMLNNGNTNDVYLLCLTAERYAQTIRIMPHYDIPSIMQALYIPVRSDVDRMKRDFQISSDDGFDEMFKAFVGYAVIINGLHVLACRGHKRYEQYL